jgi:predicted ester cyclase
MYTHRAGEESGVQTRHEEVPMSSTSKSTIESYLDALVARGDYAQYFSDDVTSELVGTTTNTHGRDATRDFIAFFHTKAFDASPKLKTLVTGDDHAAVEADFVGTHIAEFMGIAATGRSVSIPYCVIYDLTGDRITALRIYMPMELFAQQLSG